MLLGIKGDPTGFGRNSADLGYWETRQAGGNRGRFYYRLFFFFWKSWIKNFVHLFREKEGEETVSNVFFFVYRNNERVLRIIRKRREKNRGNSV